MLKRLGVAAFAAILLGAPAAQRPTTLAWLERYAAGDFDGVVALLDGTDDFKRIYRDLQHADVARWLDAGGPPDRDRRELAAATFALEAARADQWREWKWIQRAADGKLPILWWMPPPLLIEWGCALLRQTPEPRPIERIWQLAALAVAQRSEDTQFLIGFTRIETDEPVVPPLPPGPPPPLPPGLPFRGQVRGGDYFPDEVVNVQKEIGHLNHVVDRFPHEKRFMIGQGLARERPSPTDAIKVYTTLLDDPAVGGEAAVRLGAVHLRRGAVAQAMPLFDRAETSTRDPDLLYLARFYRGQALLRLRREADAIAALRGALAARPGSQAASAALASLLVRQDRRADAHALMKAVLDAGADYQDPHLEYMHGDERFWPRLIADLHREIAR
jgi:tetratricopeptide (TPR) repeat protein